MYGNKQVMAQNIIKYSKATGISYVDLAEKLGVTKSSISCWINAKYYPRINYIEEMAQIFGCNKSDLIEEHSEIMQGYDLTNEEYLLIQCYRTSDELNKEMVKRILCYQDALTTFQKGLKNEHN